MIPRLVRILACVAVGLAVLATGTWLLSHLLGDREALYEGKPFVYWLTEAKSHNFDASNHASQVIGTQIIPYLVQTMFGDTNDSAIRLALIDRLNGLPGLQVGFTPADGRRAEAASCLGEIGPQAEPAMPSLIKALKGNDRVVRPSAARALGLINSDPDAIIPLLISFLDDHQDGVPEAAASALGNFGRLSKAAVPKLVQLLEVRDKDLRHYVMLALEQIDPEEAAKANDR